MRKPFAAALLLGATTGALVLGAGGRAAMRLYSIVTEDIPYFTASGSLTVLLLGTAAGAGCGVALWAGGRLGHGSGLARQLAFWLALAALTGWALYPWSALRLQMFVPVAVVYGLATAALWRLVGPRTGGGPAAPPRP